MTAPLLTALVFAIGVTPSALASVALEPGSVESGCSAATDSGCSPMDLSQEGAHVGSSHSLLQVSKPPKSAHKVQLAEVREAASPPASKQQAEKEKATHPAKPAGIHKAQDVHHHGRHAARPVSSGDRSATATNALSFIQTAEVIEDTAVAEVGSQDMMETSKELPVTSAAEEVHVAAKHNFTDAAVLASAVFLAAWSVCWISSRRVKEVSKMIEMPKPEPTIAPAGPPCGFKEPLLPQTGASFVIPLTVEAEVGSSKAFRFKIPRHPDGPALSATVKCEPEGNTWAKVQVFPGDSDEFTSPLASCCLVNCGSDVESRNVQGAMMSWLSLLLHEKEGAEVAAVETTIQLNRALGHEQRLRACLHGIAEDLIAEGSASSGLGSMRLEVRDGCGAPAGHFEPTSKPGQYILAHNGDAVFEIEAKTDRSIALSKRGEVIALARHLGCRRNPEHPELTGEEDEHLQVDIREGADWRESALLLTCLLAMIVFKPKVLDAEVCKPKSGHVVLNEAKKGLDPADVEAAVPKDDIKGAVKCPPVHYQRKQGNFMQV